MVTFIFDILDFLKMDCAYDFRYPMKDRIFKDNSRQGPGKNKRDKRKSPEDFYFGYFFISEQLLDNYDLVIQKSVGIYRSEAFSKTILIRNPDETALGQYHIGRDIFCFYHSPFSLAGKIEQLDDQIHD
jgi:hypothetical protein